MFDMAAIVTECRKREKMTLEQVSFNCGVRTGTISKIEHGQGCKVDTLEKVLNAMGYELEVVPMK